MKLPVKLHAVCLVCALAVVTPAYAASAGPVDDGVAALSRGQFAEAINILLPLANAGDNEAQRLMGEMCFKGQGMPADATAAFRWTELAAAAGNPVGQYNLAYMFETGQGVPKSADNALKWYTASARQNYVLAQRKLADLLVAEGREAAAKNWYRQAGENGDSEARQIYSKLQGVDNDAMRRRQAAIADQERRERDRRNEEDAIKFKETLAHSEAQAEREPNSYAIINDQIRKNARETAKALQQINQAAGSLAPLTRSNPRDPAERTAGHGSAPPGRAVQIVQSTKPDERVSNPAAAVQAKAVESGKLSVTAPSSQPVSKAPSSVQTYAAQQLAAATRPLPQAAPTERTKLASKVESGTRSEAKLGPIQSEMLAICRQGKSGGWACYGALDNQVIFDEPTVESALARQHCDGGSWAAGGPTIEGVKWEAYRCNKSLGAGDYDVTERYKMATARRSYQCKEREPSDGRCTVPYGTLKD